MRAAFVLVALSLATLHGACDPGLAGFSRGGEGDSDANTGTSPGTDATVSTDARRDDARASDGSTATDGSMANTCSPDSGLRDNGSMCQDGTSCCSGACTENHRCAESCVAVDATCSPQQSTCCANTYCSVTAGTSCKACINSGATPEMVGGTPNAESCCSHQVRTFDGGSPKCSSGGGGGGGGGG